MSEGDENFLTRWSRRKSAARSAPPAERSPGDEERPGAAPERASPAPHADAVRVDPARAQPDAIAALPPLESLTPDSDFAPFMNAGVDPGVKSEALKTLFSDPALYPMDGLDVYIDDYTQPDPLPAGWLEKLNQFATLHGEPLAPGAESSATAATATGAAPTVASSAEMGEHLPSPQQSDTPVAQSAEDDSKNRGTI